MSGRAYETYTDEELYFRYLDKKPLIEFPIVSPIYNLCPHDDTCRFCDGLAENAGSIKCTGN